MAEIEDISWGDLADAAFRSATAKLVRKARLNGTPLVIWKDGKVVAVPPEELDTEPPQKPAGKNTAGGC